MNTQLPPPPPPPASAVAAVPPGCYRASDGNTYPIQPQLGTPPAAPPPPVYAPPAPAYAPPPQGFAAPAAAPPAGFAPSAFPQSNLNGVTVSGDALFPQVQGIYDLQLVSFSKRQGFKAGFAYWIGVKVLSSTAPEVPVGATFSFLCPISTGTNTFGDQRRKAILAACYAQDLNAAIDWNALSDQTEAMKLEAQPMFCQLRSVTNFSKPILDPNTKQPTGKYWCRESFLRATTAAPQV